MFGGASWKPLYQHTANRLAGHVGWVTLSRPLHFWQECCCRVNHVFTNVVCPAGIGAAPPLMHGSCTTV